MAKVKSVISAALNRLEVGQLQVAECVQFAFLAAGTLKVNEKNKNIWLIAKKHLYLHCIL